jgi:EpsI family protein
MMRRRDLVLAGLGLVSLGAAEALRPRRRLVLLKGATMSKSLPVQFAGWTAQESTLVNPAMAGRLARTLYSETVSRTYYDTSGHQIMVLVAYGDTQSDLLQLHRPESCYPAVGYTIQSSRMGQVPVGDGASVPVRRVVATKDGVVETIIYWTRLGERLPQSGGEQRTARLKNSMDGYVADGVLVRLSMLGANSDASFRALDAFIPVMLHAISRPQLPAFIGTKLANRIA